MTRNFATKPAPLPGGITKREKQVLILLAHGLTYRGVAEALGISPRTARRHIENIYRRLNISTRAEAARFAERHLLVDGNGNG